MGFGAIKVKDMETYVQQVYGLLRRETVEFEMEGQPKFASSIPSCRCSVQHDRSDRAALLGLRRARGR